MSDHSIPEIRQAVAETIKARVALFTQELVELRQRELRKSEAVGGLCITCGHEDTVATCTCLRKSEGCKTCKTELCKCMTKAELTDSQAAKGVVSTKPTKVVLPGSKKTKEIKADGAGGGGPARAE